MEIKRYITRDGREPFTEWLKELKDATAKKAIVRRLYGIEQGNFGDRKALRNGVFELRFDIGPAYRVYFAQEGQTLVVLLCGNIKGTKKHQDADIEKACQYWQDWKARKDEEK